MDRTISSSSRGSLHHNSQPPPPWRRPQHRPAPSAPLSQNLRSAAIRQVDSWRSYKDDATNLQSQTDVTSQLNASAPTFEPSSSPSQPASNTALDRPLRVSNPGAERAVLEAAPSSHKLTKKQKKKLNARVLAAGREAQMEVVEGHNSDLVQEPKPHMPHRYPIRSYPQQADQPIPSIEPAASTGLSTARRFARKSYRSPTKSPEVPEVSVKYRLEAAKEPTTHATPQKLLIILDLNGTLLYRTRNGASGKVHLRPGLTPLLDYLFANHVVMVFTSAMPSSASSMLKQFLHPKHRSQLAAVWARDRLELNPEQYHNKVQVYKKLDKIWQDAEIQKRAPAHAPWDQTNTVLVDDSKLKAISQPHNLIQVSEYTSKDDPARNKKSHDQAAKIQRDILKQLEMKLEELKYQKDVSRLIRRWQTGEVLAPRLPGQEVVVEETVDQKEATDSNLAESPALPADANNHLPTPDSSDDCNVNEETPKSSWEKVANQSAPLSPVSSVDEEAFRVLLGEKRRGP